MAKKNIVLFCLLAVSQVAFGQILGRMGAGGCGCGCGGLPFVEQYLPAPYQQPAVVYDPPTTIIQDSTVANNLANALQLLVVSNLLSSTLPLEPAYELVAPTSIAPCGAQLAPIGAQLAPLGAQLAQFGPQIAQIGPQLAPLSLAPSYVSQCGCGGCGGCGCGQYPYNILF